MMDDATKHLMGEAAALIRTELWLSSKPPPGMVGGRPWTMNRDLSIWKILVEKGKFEPYEINGAITQVRRLKPDWTGPLRMTIFYWMRKNENGVHFNATPFLMECIGSFRKSESVDSRRRANMPEQAKEVLRKMLQ